MRFYFSSCYSKTIIWRKKCFFKACSGFLNFFLLRIKCKNRNIISISRKGCVVVLGNWKNSTDFAMVVCRIFRKLVVFLTLIFTIVFVIIAVKIILSHYCTLKTKIQLRLQQQQFCGKVWKRYTMLLVIIWEGEGTFCGQSMIFSICAKIQSN